MLNLLGDADSVLDWYLNRVEEIETNPDKYRREDLAIAACDRDGMLRILIECLPHKEKRCDCGRCGR